LTTDYTDFTDYRNPNRCGVKNPWFKFQIACGGDGGIGNWSGVVSEGDFERFR
jgi:hypothetical protein